MNDRREALRNLTRKSTKFDVIGISNGPRIAKTFPLRTLARLGTSRRVLLVQFYLRSAESAYIRMMTSAGCKCLILEKT